jgi:hypothetical protein
MEKRETATTVKSFIFGFPREDWKLGNRFRFWTFWSPSCNTTTNFVVTTKYGKERNYSNGFLLHFPFPTRALECRKWIPVLGLSGLLLPTQHQ